MTTLSIEMRDESREKRKFSQSDTRLYRCAKKQRRNSKVGRMFFADMKQARDELQKESNYLSYSDQSTFTIPLDQLFVLKRNRIDQDLDSFDSITHDTPFGFLMVPFLNHEKQEAAIDRTIVQNTKSLSIQTDLLDTSS